MQLRVGGEAFPSGRIHGTFSMGYVPGEQSYGPQLQVCVISWDWLREWCWQRLLVFYDRYSPYTYVQPLPEGVIEARRAGDTYILLCEDRVLTVFPGWEMTAEQLEAIVLRLSGV